MKKMLTILLALTMLLCAPCAQAKSYRYGDTADEVATLQTALTQLKLYYTEITGHYGKRTRAAVEKFQKKYSLPKTGVADEATRKLLYELTDVSAPAAGQGGGSFTVLRNGSENSAVRALQENLHALGYYDGVITGHYGNLTQEAVRVFQKKNKLDADGIAGAKTLGRIAELLGTSSGVATGTSGTSSSALPGLNAANEAYGTAMLSLNMSGSAVRTLQENLAAIGYYKGSITGTYGRLTKEAVRVFQKEHDLDADGVAGPRTFAKLNEKLGASCENGAAAPNPTPAPGAPTTTAAPVATPSPTPATAHKYALDGTLSTDRVLRRTSRSGYVTRLQNALGLLGYFTDEPTGYFGSVTEEAVKAYQTARGLTCDGVAGRATLSAINDDLASGKGASVD